MDINDKVERLATEGYQFNLSYYISEGYELFKRNVGGFILFILVFFAISVVLAFIPILGSIASVVISPALTAGFYMAAKKVKNGETVEFGQFFDGFKLGAPIFLVGLISQLLVFVGCLLLLIPGIYLGVAYTFAALFVTFHKMDFWPAMEASRRVISKNWFNVFGFVLVLGLINMGGAIVLGIGLLVTIPISMCAIYVAFEEVVGTGSEEVEEEF
jgi:uncharacterized membrane protein